MFRARGTLDDMIGDCARDREIEGDFFQKIGCGDIEEKYFQWNYSWILRKVWEEKLSEESQNQNWFEIKYFWNWNWIKESILISKMSFQNSFLSQVQFQGLWMWKRCLIKVRGKTRLNWKM